MNYRPILVKVLIILSIISCIVLLLSQMMRNYLLIMLSLFLFSFSASYYIIVYKHSRSLLVLIFIVIPLVIKVIMTLSLSDKWLLANEDLIYMIKIPEKIVTTARYPFNDVEILTNRPNYLEYPSSFLLQAMLSLILDVDIDVLMLFPIASWIAYTIILSITLNVVSRDQHNKVFRSHYVTYIMGLLMFNFLTLAFLNVFIYSNIIRALIVLYIYVLLKYAIDLKFRSKCTFTLLTLLSISIVLGHSQEPTMLFLYLVLLTLVSTIIKSLRGGDVNNVIHKGLTLSMVAYIALFLFINMFYSIATYSSTIKYILTLISNILGKVSLEALIIKEKIASQVLTHLELCTLYITLLFNVVVILEILMRCLKEGRGNIFILSIVISSGIFLIINGLTILHQGILSDLIFRPLWIFLCSLMLISISTKNMDFNNQSLRRGNIRFERIITSLLIISLSLFIVSNVIYSRYHILTSDVYTHESLTIEMLSSLKKLISSSNMLHSKTLIIDTPKNPSYEIFRALTLLTNITCKVTIIYLNPEVQSYYYSYLNGISKSRNILENADDIAIITNLNDYLNLIRKIVNGKEFYVIGEIKPYLRYYLNIIFSIDDENLGLGFYSIIK